MSAGEVIEVDPATGRVVEAAADRRWRIAGRVIGWVLVGGAVGYAIAWLAAPLADTSAPLGVVVSVAALVGGLVGGAVMILSYPAMLFALGAIMAAVLAPTSAWRKSWLITLAWLLAIVVAGRIVAPLVTAAVADRIG